MDVELPPPPAPIEAPVMFAARPPRAGELTPAWRVVFGLGWVGVVLALAAVWKSGRTLGLSPWWLGPESDPNLFVVQMVPFVLPAAMILGAMRNIRHLPYWGVGAAVGVAAVAAGDVGRFNGLAAIEFLAAGAGLLVSVAALAGCLRDAPGGAEPSLVEPSRTAPGGVEPAAQ